MVWRDPHLQPQTWVGERRVRWPKTPAPTHERRCCRQHGSIPELPQRRRIISFRRIPKDASGCLGILVPRSSVSPRTTACEATIRVGSDWTESSTWCPSSYGGDDSVWVGVRGEGPGVCFGLGDEAVDGGLQVDDGAEDAALEATSAELDEKAHDGIEPRAASWPEVENEPGMPFEPRAQP